MTMLTILEFPDPRLRTKAQPVSAFDAPLQSLIDAMFATMYPDFVFPAPKWETASCSDFGLCPHLSGPANAVISKTIGEYFLTH